MGPKIKKLWGEKRRSDVHLSAIVGYMTPYGTHTPKRSLQRSSFEERKIVH